MLVGLFSLIKSSTEADLSLCHRCGVGGSSHGSCSVSTSRSLELSFFSVENYRDLQLKFGTLVALPGVLWFELARTDFGVRELVTTSLAGPSETSQNYGSMQTTSRDFSFCLSHMQCYDSTNPVQCFHINSSNLAQGSWRAMHFVVDIKNFLHLIRHPIHLL